MNTLQLMLKVSRSRFPLVTHDNSEVKSILDLTRRGEIKWKLEEASRYGFAWNLKFSASFQNRNIILEKKWGPDDGLWTIEEHVKLLELKDGKEILLGYYFTHYDRVEIIEANGDAGMNSLVDEVKNRFPELARFF